MIKAKYTKLFTLKDTTYFIMQKTLIHGAKENQNYRMKSPVLTIGSEKVSQSKIVLKKKSIARLHTLLTNKPASME